MSGHALVPAARLSLDAFAAAAGLHPEFVRKLVTLGLLDPYLDGTGRAWFRPAELSEAARIRRLRAGLALNYTAIGVVLDLLDRIDDLEAALRTRPSTRSDGVTYGYASRWRSTR